MSGAEVDHGRGPFRTWDGHPVSEEPPHGAMIVVYRCRDDQAEFLLLHRQHHGPDYEGNWAWTPPSGARYPGEAIERCARRELAEETQLTCAIQAAGAGALDWPVFVAHVRPDAAITLSAEHDRYLWLALDEAAARLAPAIVHDSFVAIAGQLAATCDE
jgi:8-oxo-dGTP pyrophosphatase MutT (NUDIX family)